ncbi:hypothetical protein BD779DRAFT_1675490 [Infundibulicybe gibba]|nr:hypothetical protein BD779DRAFT_1676450 [Infundibulicybe gibba]KAF8881350.1 hypothetical protein BD779DRAFT_1675490 [Infundibulicybe gibba]
MSNATALEFNVQKAMDELASTEANDILITDLGKRKKAGGGVAARRASSKRVAEARSALALAKEQLQEAQERVDQVDARSAAPTQTPTIEELAHRDPGSTETSGAATQSLAAKEVFSTAPQPEPTSDSTLNLTTGTHGIEPLAATGTAALGPGRIPAVLPPITREPT